MLRVTTAAVGPVPGAPETPSAPIPPLNLASESSARASEGTSDTTAIANSATTLMAASPWWCGFVALDSRNRATRAGRRPPVGGPPHGSAVLGPWRRSGTKSISLSGIDQPVRNRSSRRLSQVTERSVTGNSRMRRPVSANTALAIAGATGGTPGSPMPPGGPIAGHDVHVDPPRRLGEAPPGFLAEKVPFGDDRLEDARRERRTF